MLATWLCMAGASGVYTVDHLVPPPGSVLEIGGMDWLPDGRLAVSTRRGQVWIVDHALDPDPAQARFELFCEGLQEGLGLRVVDGAIHVLQRMELTRLDDLDRDGTCDRLTTISDRFGVSGNYHEFAFGLPVDARGHFFAALNVGFTDPKWWHGRSLAPWRGWVIDIAPDGSIEPFASGFRSPCGIGTNAAGDLFVTDNQGDWVPACPLIHVQKGRFYGAPASLAWTDAYQKTGATPSLTNPVDAGRTPPALWIPYAWSRSTGDMRPIPRDGSFGPFEDQLVLAELTNGLVLRADLEQVRGEYQGAVFRLVDDVGSAIRTLFAPDGTLLLGLTNRGWGGLAPGHGLARVRWSGTSPFEIEHVRLRMDGFELTFTEPLAADLVLGPANFDVSLYHYDWWWEYGSPERGDGARTVSAVEIADDRRALLLRVPIEPGHVARVVARGLVSRSGRELAHAQFDYTVNQLPEGPLCQTPVARVAPPPPPKATQEEGWLRLTYDDALDLWREKDGWSLVDAELDPDDPARFAVRAGNGALVNTAGSTRDLVSTPEFGDAEFALSILLARGAGTEVRIGGRYTLRIAAGADVACGAVVGTDGGGDIAPREEFHVVPGNWHKLEIDYRAPRFDPEGARIQKARLEFVRLDGVVLQEDLELEGPSAGVLVPEAALGPLVLVGTPASVAFGDVRAKPAPPPRGPAPRALLSEDGLEGWRTAPDAAWKREEDVLACAAGHGRLVSAPLESRDVRVHARARVGGGGLAALVLRASADPARTDGVAILMNADHRLAARTGSIRLASEWDSANPTAGSTRTVALVGPDTWFDLDVELCETGADTCRVDVRVNGVLVNTSTLATSAEAGTAIAIDNHHDGSVVEIEALELLPLSGPATDRSPPPPR